MKVCDARAANGSYTVVYVSFILNDLSTFMQKYVCVIEQKIRTPINIRLFKFKIGDLRKKILVYLLHIHLYVIYKLTRL